MSSEKTATRQRSGSEGGEGGCDTRGHVGACQRCQRGAMLGETLALQNHVLRNEALFKGSLKYFESRKVSFDSTYFTMTRRILEGFIHRFDALRDLVAATYDLGPGRAELRDPTWSGRVSQQGQRSQPLKRPDVSPGPPGPQRTPGRAWPPTGRQSRKPRKPVPASRANPLKAPGELAGAQPQPRRRVEGGCQRGRVRGLPRTLRARPRPGRGRGCGWLACDGGAWWGPGVRSHCQKRVY